MSVSPRVVAVAAAVALAGIACSSSQPKVPRQRMTVKEILERSKPAIVRVEVGEDRVGTGFAIDPTGIIATNLHVVQGAEAVEIKMLDGRRYPVKRVVAFDDMRDLALLALDLEQPMPFLALGDSDKVAAGDPVIAIGHPAGVLDYTVSDGLISAVRIATDDFTLLQISAPISQGSSGGPLFNPFGEVIGVATAIFTAGQNLNFAVPSKYLQPMVARPQPMTMAEFAAATTMKIERQVPVHDLALLEGCSDQQIEQVASEISDAIAVGAPLYNQGDHEACYRIYEHASAKMAVDAGCAGVREAFKHGLARAAMVEGYKEKAWALRDTFDGLIDVILRKARAGDAAPQ